MPGLTAKALGWGLITNDVLNPQGTDILQQSDMQIVSKEFANLPEYYRGRVSDTMISAGEFNPYKSVHSGDSGGPLLMINPDNNEWMQIGIASYAAGCNILDNPIGVFTKVSVHADWVNNVIENDFLQWTHEKGLNQLNFDDGDSNAPLFEWMFGLDPKKADSLNANYVVQWDPSSQRDYVHLPLQIHNTFQKIDLHKLRSHDLKDWFEVGFDWDLLTVEEETSTRPTFNIPVVSERDLISFNKVEIPDISGIKHGPTNLRMGSSAKGYIGKPNSFHGIDAYGPTLYEYLLECHDPGQSVSIQVDYSVSPNLSFRIIEVETGNLIIDSNVTSKSFTNTFTPSTDLTYIVRMESPAISGILSFEIFADYATTSTYSPLEIPIKGNLSIEDTPYKREGYFSDRYRYNLNDNPFWKVKVESETLDPIIVIKNASLNKILHQIDEEPPGVAEEYIVVAKDAIEAEILVGSWRYEETGDYEITVSTFFDKNSASPGDDFQSILSPSDYSQRQDGIRWFFHYITLSGISLSQGATISVWGVEDFNPYFGIYDNTKMETVHQAYAFCQEARYYFQPAPGNQYELVIFSVEENVGENFRVQIQEGNLLESNELTQNISNIRSKTEPIPTRDTIKMDVTIPFRK